MAQLICIANSRRPDGRCVAGIDVRTGEFIRPVPPQSDSIPEERVYFDGGLLTVGAQFELELRKPRRVPRYQRENQTIVDWNWKHRGRVSPTSLRKYCDDATPLLHSKTDRVAPAVLDRLPPHAWRSLQLAPAREPRFERDPIEQHRWRIRFLDAAGTEYFLKITDPITNRKLESGTPLASDLLALVSLTKPWVPPDGSRPPLCYKLVATVIELPGG